MERHDGDEHLRHLRITRLANLKKVCGIRGAVAHQVSSVGSFPLFQVAESHGWDESSRWH